MLSAKRLQMASSGFFRWKGGVDEKFKTLFTSGTYAGETMSLAAGQSCVNKLALNNVPDHLHAMENYLKLSLRNFLLKPV